jgi:hypothetical protein
VKSVSDMVATLPQRKDHAPLRGRRRRDGACKRCPRPTRFAVSERCLGVAGCCHGVVGLEPELLAVGFRRELVRDVELAPKCFLLLAADQADEMIVMDRTADWHGRLRRGRLRLRLTEGAERSGNRTDQIAQLGHGDGVVGNVGDDDLGCELGDRPRLLPFLFFGIHRHGSASA